MLFIRWKINKNKKAMTLVEMVVAIAVTAILAICLSMVMSPVMNTYTVNKARAELATYADTVLNHIAADFRGARNIMLVAESKDSPYPAYSLPGFMGGKPATVEINYAYCLHDLYLDRSGKSIKGNRILSKVTQTNYDYLRRIIYPAHLNYPDVYGAVDMKEFNSSRTNDGQAMHYTLKDPITSTGSILVDGDRGFYMLVKSNPDDENRGNIIDLHLRLIKGKVKYETMKSVVCENLVINKMWAQKATMVYQAGGLNGKDNAVISTNDTIGKNGCTPYYSAWFGIGIGEREKK